jgi:hypothetical protein
MSDDDDEEVEDPPSSTIIILIISPSPPSPPSPPPRPRPDCKRCLLLLGWFGRLETVSGSHGRPRERLDS